MSGKSEVPEEAVEAAARALTMSSPTLRLQYDDMRPHGQEVWRDRARAALEAAAPFISAKALEDAADRFEQRSETLLKTMTNMAGHPDTSPDDVVRYGAYSAEANTTDHWLRARAAAVRGEG